MRRSVFNRRGVLWAILSIFSMVFFSFVFFGIFCGLFLLQFVLFSGQPFTPFAFVSLNWRLYLLPIALGLATGLLFAYWLQRLRKKRQNEESRFRTFFNAVEQSANYVVITDAKGRIEYINPAFLQKTGYSFQEVVGKNPNIWKSEKHGVQFYRIFWQSLLSGRSWRGEICNKTKEGSLYWASVTVSPIRNEKNETVNFIAIYEDITHTKALHEGIAVALENAKAASAAKSHFISAMSHELKTPLTAILGFAGLLSEELKNSTYKEYAQLIQQSGEYLFELISDILDLARLESESSTSAQKLEMELRPVELLSVLNEAARIVRPMYEKKTLQFETRFSGGAFWAKANPLRLKQSVLNLLSNAIKYTPAGGSIVLACGPLKKGLFRISVEDTGMGIPEEKQGLVFEAFNRLGQEASSSKGTGLGLTLSKQFIESMGGKIGFTSQPGKGSVFWIDLLAAEKPAPGLEGEGELSRKEKESGLLKKNVRETNTEKKALENLRLLLVEDDASNRLFLKAVIEKEGGKLTAVSSIGEARAALQAPNSFDWILSDLNLPDGSGLGLLEESKKNPKTSSLPFVILTADSDPFIHQKCLDAGATSVLAKPLNPKELLALF